MKDLKSDIRPNNLWIIDPEINEYEGSRFYGEYNCFTNEGGQGALIYDDGDKYIGGIMNGGYHGQGEYLYQFDNPCLFYKGEWGYDKKNGYGTYKWKNGAEHTGYWKDDNCHGKGVYKDSNG